VMSVLGVTLFICGILNFPCHEKFNPNLFLS
jgi:hypothetical protein